MYLEMHLPLVSSLNSFTGIRSLEFQVAARHDNYRTTGARLVTVDESLMPTEPIISSSAELSSTDPTVALRYQPFHGVIVRGSYGTGFLPPAVDQLVPSGAIEADPGLTDPLRNNEALGSSIITTSGGNPDLRPEQSKSWSAGFIVEPQAIAGLRLSVDWTRTKKWDNIASFEASFTQAGLNTAIQVAPERIERAAASDGFEVGPIIGIDDTLVNIAKLEAEALDFSVDYGIDAGTFGRLNLFLQAVALKSKPINAVLPDQKMTEQAGVYAAVG